MVPFILTATGINGVTGGGGVGEGEGGVDDTCTKLEKKCGL